MKYQNLIVSGIIILSAVNLWAQANVYHQEPVEDAYVDSVQVNSNFNTDSLQIQGFGNDPFAGSGVASVQRTFLKFDVSSLQDQQILSAVFGIYLSSYSNYSTPTLQLYRVGDGWNETDVTWNSSQSLAAAATAIETDELGDSLRYYEWNVFPSWDNGDVADGFVSYMLTVGQQNLNNYGYFPSSEGSVNQPYLHIEYIPEPATIALLSFGAVLIGKHRRIFRSKT